MAEIDTIEQPQVETPEPTPQGPGDDKLRALHDAVAKDYNIGSFDDFKKNLQDPAKRQSFYNTVGKDYNLGTYDEFQNKIGVTPQQPQIDTNRDSRVRQEHPEISDLHDSNFVDSVMNANKDKNFVQRYLNPSEFPVINNEDGSYSTHRMASSDDIAYPTIIQRKDGTLKQLGDKEARQYAINSGEFIKFKSEKDADWFADNGYKLGNQISAPDHEISGATLQDARRLRDMTNKPIAPDRYANVGEYQTSSSVPDAAALAENKAYQDQYTKAATDLSSTWGAKPETVKQVLNDFPDEPDENKLKQFAQTAENNPAQYHRIKADNDIRMGIAKSDIQPGSIDPNLLTTLPGNASHENSAVGLANAFNDLNQFKDFHDLEFKIPIQQQMIRQARLGPEAMNNLKDAQSPLINSLDPGLLSKYWNGDDKALGLTPDQYAGLETERLFSPQKAQMDLDMIKHSRNLDESGQANPIDVSKEPYEYRRGLETVLMNLDLQGRNNKARYIMEQKPQVDAQMADLVKSYNDKLATANPTDAVQLHQQFNNEPLVQEANKLEQGKDEIAYSAAEDAMRYPLTHADQATRIVKDAMQGGTVGMADLRGIMQGAGESADNTMRWIKNTAVNLVGSDGAKAFNNTSNIGHQELTELSGYEGSGYTGVEQPLNVPRGITDGVQSIFKDPNLTDAEKQQKAISYVRDNFDKLTVNPKAGQQNMTGKAVVYQAANTVGQILGIADQSFLMGGVIGDASKLQQMASAFTPMYMTTQNQMYEQALKNGDEHPLLKSNTDATIISLASLINPDIKVVRGMVGAESALGKTLAGISDETWGKVLSENAPLVDRAMAAAKATGKQLGLANLQYGLIAPVATGLAHKVLFNEDPNLLDRVKDGVIQTSISMALPALLHGVWGGMRATEVNPTQKYALVEAGLHPDENIDLIDSRIKAGQISEVAGHDMKMLVKHAGEFMLNQEMTKTDGTPMNEKEVADNLYTNLRLKVLEGKLKTAAEPMKPVIEERIHELNKDIADLHTSEDDKNKAEMNQMLHEALPNIILKMPTMEGPIKDAIAANEPEKVLREIADQATDVTNVDGKEVSTRSQTEEIFGKPLVEKAIELSKQKSKNNGKETNDNAQTEGQVEKSGGAETNDTVRGAAPSIQEPLNTENETKGQNKGDGNNPQLPIEKSGSQKSETISQRFSKIEDVTDPYDRVLKYFGEGGKIHTSEIEKLFGNRRKATENEKRARIGLIGKNAHTIDSLAHDLWETDPTGHNETQDYKDAIERVLYDHVSKSSMQKDLVDRYDIDAAQEKYLSQKYGQEAIDITNGLSEDELNHILQLDADKSKSDELENYIDQLKKNKNNAIQEPSTSGILQHPQEGVGETGSGRGGVEQGQQGANPPAESGQQKEAVPASGEEAISDELPFGRLSVGVAHDLQVDRSRAELGMSEPERGAGVTIKDSIDNGKELLKNGADVGQIVADFQKDKNISYDKMSVVRAAYNELADKTNKAADQYGADSPQAKSAATAERSFYNSAVKPMQTEWSKAGVAQQGAVDLDTGSVTALRRSFEERSGKQITGSQLGEAKEMSDKVKTLEAKIEKLKKRLDEAIQGNKKQGGIKETGKALADKIRKAKIHRPDMFSAATPASLVWDSAVELTAKSVEAGANIADAIAKGVDHIKNSDWYKGLKPNEQSKAEQQFSDFHNQQANEKVDLKTHFVDKTDNNFSTDEIKAIWDHTKKVMETKTDFHDVVNQVGMDTGLTNEQVRRAISQPKGAKAITDEMYANMYRRNQVTQQAKAWVNSADQSALKKFWNKIIKIPSAIVTFGHGSVAPITHVGADLYRPSNWKSYFNFMLDSYKYSFGGVTDAGKARYEKAMSDLTHDPMFIMAKRAGLKIDPTDLSGDDYSKYQGVFGKISKMGERGFNAMKPYRLEQFKKIYNGISDQEKSNPDVVKAIAHMVNLSSGTTDAKIPEGADVIMFAPKLVTSQYQRIFTEPAKAVATFANWNKSTDADKLQAKMVARHAGEMVATYMALLTANQGILSMTGSKQKINFTNPLESDWMKFKAGNKTIDASGGMNSALRFVASLGEEAARANGIVKTPEKNKPGDVEGNKILQQMTNKLSPFAGDIKEAFSGTDMVGNTLPWSAVKPGAGKVKLGWSDYLETKMPIPLSEGFKTFNESAKDKGMPKPVLDRYLEAVMVGGLTGTTGAHVGPDYSLEPKQAKGGRPGRGSSRNK